MEYSAKLKCLTLKQICLICYFKILYVLAHFVYYENEQKENIKFLLKWSILYRLKPTLFL